MPNDVFDGLNQAITFFRIGQEGAGCDALVQFIDRFSELLMSRQVVIDLMRFQEILQTSVAAQERGDFLWVADLLQYELKPLCGLDSGGDGG